jgi:hypothetical protein
MREVAGNPTAAGSALTPNVEINGVVAATTSTRHMTTPEHGVFGALRKSCSRQFK